MSDQYGFNEKINEVKKELSDFKLSLENRIYRIELDRQSNNSLFKLGLMMVIYILVLALVFAKYDKNKKSRAEPHSASYFYDSTSLKSVSVPFSSRL
jgi:hypothetical protein